MRLQELLLGRGEAEGIAAQKVLGVDVGVDPVDLDVPTQAVGGGRNGLAWGPHAQDSRFVEDELVRADGPGLAIGSGSDGDVVLDGLVAGGEEDGVVAEGIGVTALGPPEERLDAGLREQVGEAAVNFVEVLGADEEHGVYVGVGVFAWCPDGAGHEGGEDAGVTAEKLDGTLVHRPKQVVHSWGPASRVAPHAVFRAGRPQLLQALPGRGAGVAAPARGGEVAAPARGGEEGSGQEPGKLHGQQRV